MKHFTFLFLFLLHSTLLHSAKAGKYALHRAARAKNIRTVKKLISEKVDVTARNKYGETALTIAVNRKHYPSIFQLQKAFRKTVKKSDDTCPICLEEYKNISLKKLWILRKCCCKVICKGCYDQVKSREKCTWCRRRDWH